MRWSRPCTPRQPGSDGSLTHHPIGESNTSASAIANDWPKPASSRQWAVLATIATMHWLRRSTACTRPNGSIAVRLGKAANPSNWPPWNGSPGSTINACTHRSPIFRQSKLRQTTTTNPAHLPTRLFYFNQTASVKPRGDLAWPSRSIRRRRNCVLPRCCNAWLKCVACRDPLPWTTE
jgi:hypothetical protein